ncbi:thioredoxin family protein [Paenibacillus cremeus]|uniref:Thioredoxin family protein n=1 Tax=Paenibacillus cremeus TaxID=2163881 RepID=A0A559KDB2_9BACL|nr:thioredoxin family protein [Paenibacillus cremeus]TVY10105.1 thioredoxin family protein [Paenibacillus cremeus]
MQLQEWSEEQLKNWTAESRTGQGNSELEVPIRFVFFYTPLCGTCKVGERMLEVVLELNPMLPLGKCNVNACRTLPYEWQIESVPCLLRWEQGQVQAKRYRLSAVDELYRFMS